MAKYVHQRAHEFLGAALKIVEKKSLERVPLQRLQHDPLETVPRVPDFPGAGLKRQRPGRTFQGADAAAQTDRSDPGQSPG